MHSTFRLFGLALLLSFISSSLFAQAKRPKPPETYDVHFRYRIKDGVNGRIKQFEAMEAFLKKHEFKRTVDEDSDLDILDPDAERMFGTIPGGQGRALLQEPHIQTILLVPAGLKAADDGTRVKVLLELSGGFPPHRQQMFSNQTKQVLGVFGFQEATGYDHAGYTLLRGTMPWGKVPTLLKDLRGQPSGWFLPLIHEDDTPDPFKTRLPIRLIEVLPEEGAPEPVMGQAELPPVPADQPQLVKLTAEARRFQLADPKARARVNLILAIAPDESDNSWRTAIRDADPTAAIEGLLGNVVTVTGVPSDLAKMRSVLSVRVPHSSAAMATLEPKEEPKKEDKKDDEKKDEPKKVQNDKNLILAQATAEVDVLKETRLDRLHAQGKRGTGIRVAIIDTDFTGWEKYVGKELPATTHYLDLTVERNREIVPDPLPAQPVGMGHGTHCALAVRLAAPDADIVLVRISPDAPYEVVTAFRAMQNDFFQPDSFRIRREELDNDTNLVRGERLNANEAYRKAFDDFDDDEPARERRRAARAAINAVEIKEKQLTQRAERLLKLERDVLFLRGTKVVVCTVGWNAGQALDASSPLARYLDSRMSVARPAVVFNASKRKQPMLWFQPAGNTRGQAWLGEFRDTDDNGYMEFAPFDAPRKPGRWSPELNFLAFRTDGKPDVLDLPANTRVRISIQWREPHDPEINVMDYRLPIAPLNLMLLRQRDPSGEKLAMDEMEIMARTDGSPEQLRLEPEYGVYEQSIDLTLPAEGRYAIRVSGKQPNSIRPGGSLGIRDQEIRWELKPRIFVEVLDAPTREKGRIVFGDYETFFTGVSVPADARSVVAVGAMHASKKPQGYSAIGAGLVSDLFVKPEVMTYDHLPKLGDGTGPARGTPLSASFAAGMSACLLTAGAQSGDFLYHLGIPPGSVFEIPEGWIRK